MNTRCARALYIELFTNNNNSNDNNINNNNSKLKTLSMLFVNIASLP